MHTCQSCEHWSPAINHSIEEGRAGGYCTHPNLREELDQWQDYGPRRLVYPYHKSGYFWTAADFGCVNHPLNQPTSTEPDNQGKD